MNGSNWIKHARNKFMVTALGTATPHKLILGLVTIKIISIVNFSKIND